MTTIGYARVSTEDQHLEGQINRLKKAGAERVFEDVASGAKASRPGWDRCREYLREGDVLVAVKLDRLGRSVQHLAELAADLDTRGVGLQVLDQAIDTTTASGRMLFHMLSAIAEFERELIAERTRDGIARAVAQGKRPGRARLLSDGDIERAQTMYADTSLTVKEIARAVGCSETTLRRAIGAQGPKSIGEGRPRGRVGGRKRGLSDDQVARMQRMYDERTATVKEIAKQFQVSPATVYKYLTVGTF